jgi:hypothetical protein
MNGRDEQDFGRGSRQPSARISAWHLLSGEFSKQRFGEGTNDGIRPPARDAVTNVHDLVSLVCRLNTYNCLDTDVAAARWPRET